MDAPLLTIVIPVYNRADVVGATLDSVAAQTLRPLRLVVVDNGSTDGSLERVSAWADAHRAPGFEVTVVEEREFHTASAARNRGFREVTTPLVMFFDSDDTMLPGHAARAVAAFEADPQLDIAGWDVELRYPDGRRLTLPFADRDMLFRNLHNGIMATQRYAMRSSLLRRAGGWDASLAGWNDMELGMRLLSLRPRVKRLEGAPTVVVNHSAESITGSGFSHSPARWEAALSRCDATLGPEGLRAVNLRRAILAGLYRREGSAQWRRLMAEVSAREPDAFRRLLLRGAALYTSLGLRGVNRLLRPFFDLR